MNEFSLIFNTLGIDTESVLKAAGSKWNFLPFQPGLVGGHCIHVDPYYLAHKSIEAGYHPEIILAGRRLNDRMGTYVANKVKQLFEKKSISIIDSKVLIMGLTFKENCPDLRNTNVINVYKKLDEFGCYIDIYDPIADKNQAKLEFGLTLIDYPKENSYDAIILAVAHDEFSKMTSKQIKTFAKDNFVLFDVKYLLEANEVDGRL